MSKPIFSTRVDDQNPVHTRISIFNRGGNSGVLVVNTDDADELIRRLEGNSAIVNQQIDTVEQHASVVGVTIERLG